jgi:hypothetical protein
VRRCGSLVALPLSASRGGEGESQPAACSCAPLGRHPLLLEMLRRLSRFSGHIGGGRMASVVAFLLRPESFREFFSGGLRQLVPSPRSESKV